MGMEVLLRARGVGVHSVIMLNNINRRIGAMAVVRNQMQLLIHIVGSQDLTGQSFKFQFPAFNYRQRVGLYIVAKPATRVVHER